MAKDTERVKPQNVVAYGIDESTDRVDPSALTEANGVFPYFYNTAQRLFGKKIIDFNPGHQVLSIHQVFSGVCVYGYFVETNLKLYYHVCSAPPDLRIRFATLQS